MTRKRFWSRRGHNYLTLVADMQARRVVFVTPERNSATIAEFAQCLRDHQATPGQIESVSIDMSPAFIKGVDAHLPNARVTFDKFHVVAHAGAAVGKMRRLEPKTDPDLKGLRWALLKDRDKLRTEQRNDLDALVAQFTSKRTAAVCSRLFCIASAERERCATDFIGYSHFY